MIEISTSIVALQSSLPVRAAAVGVSSASVDEANIASQNTNATQTLSVGPPSEVLTSQALLAIQEDEAAAPEDANREAGNDQKSVPNEEKTQPQDLTAAEQAQISKLQQVDTDVRRHEQAHAAVGGGQAGAPSYEYTKGPDGKQYATSGEVSISLPTGGDDPESRIEGLRKVQQAAMAPANPSPQDLRVAASAAQAISQAEGEIRQEQSKTKEPNQENSEKVEGNENNFETSIDANAFEVKAADVSAAQATRAFQAAANLTVNNQSPVENYSGLTDISV